MTDEQDIDMLAAEYVLGTLPADERAAVALRARHDAPLAAAIAAWETRLAPLNETIVPQSAPQHLWAKILDRIAAPPNATVTSLADMERRLRRERCAASYSGCAAWYVLPCGRSAGRFRCRPKPLSNAAPAGSVRRYTGGPPFGIVRCGV